MLDVLLPDGNFWEVLTFSQFSTLCKQPTWKFPSCFRTACVQPSFKNSTLHIWARKWLLVTAKRTEGWAAELSYPSTRRLYFPFSWLMTARSTVGMPCTNDNHFITIGFSWTGFPEIRRIRKDVLLYNKFLTTTGSYGIKGACNLSSLIEIHQPSQWLSEACYGENEDRSRVSLYPNEAVGQ